MSNHLRTTIVAALAAALSSLSLAGPALAHDPIVFVHGYSGSGSNWNTMIANFKADGWTTAELPTPANYSNTGSNVDNAKAVASQVDKVLKATGATKVDIIAHSMGSLSSRYYLKNLGGAAKIDDWVSLGGPNHGTDWAFTCFTTPCLEMRTGSSFVTALNSGDETPGAVTYGTWASPSDELVTPYTSTFLSGAANTTTARMSHLALITDPTVYGQVRDFVR